jgi:hypothetical protein
VPAPPGYSPTTTDVVERALPAAAPTGSDVTGMDAGHRPGRLRRLRIVLDFSSLEGLTLLPLSLSLRAFKRACLAAACAATLSLASVAWMGLAVLAGMWQDQPQSLAFVVAAAVFVNVYLGLAYLFGELGTRRRYRLSNSPNVGLFRSLDIAAGDAFVVYGLLPTTGFFLLLGVADLAVAESAMQEWGDAGAESLLSEGGPTPLAGGVVFFAVVAMVIGAASLRFRSRDLARAV